jgi:XTP/dITP diphosphohydrolase
MKEILYVTGNWAKIMSAKEVLEPMGIKVKNKKIKITEIQDDSVEEVAKYSAKEASEKLKCDVLKNDTGLFVETLGGFPGPYTHYADDKLGEEKLLKLLKGEKNRKAKFIECYAYCEYGKKPLVFKSVTNGIIAEEKSGKYGWSWDFIFIPAGEEKTLANFPDEERCLKWDNTGLYELAKYISGKK